MTRCITIFPSDVAACIGQNFYQPRNKALAKYLQRYSPFRAELKNVTREHERVRSALQQAMYSVPAEDAAHVVQEIMTTTSLPAPEPEKKEEQENKQEEKEPVPAVEPTPVPVPETKEEQEKQEEEDPVPAVEPAPVSVPEQEQGKQEEPVVEAAAADPVAPAVPEPEPVVEPATDETPMNITPDAAASDTPVAPEPAPKKARMAEEAPPAPAPAPAPAPLPHNAAIQRAKELIVQSTIRREQIQQLVTTVGNQTNGTRLEKDAYTAFLDETDGRYELLSRHQYYRGQEFVICGSEEEQGFAVLPADGTAVETLDMLGLFDLSAEVDGIVKDTQTGKNLILEIKTRQNRLFKTVPQYEAIQVRTYQALLADEEGVTGGVLFQWYPPTGECSVHRVMCDSHKWNTILNGLALFVLDLYKLMSRPVEAQEEFIAQFFC